MILNAGWYKAGRATVATTQIVGPIPKIIDLGLSSRHLPNGVRMRVNFPLPRMVLPHLHENMKRWGIR